MRKLTLYKVILILSIIIQNHSALAQEGNNNNVVLKHNVRKLQFDSIINVGQEIRPSKFIIKLPDSIYNESIINIKNLRIQDVKNINTAILSREQYIYSLTYQIRGNNKAKKFLALILEQLEIKKEDLESGEITIDNKLIMFNYEKSKRYHYFIFNEKKVTNQ